MDAVGQRTVQAGLYMLYNSLAGGSCLSNSLRLQPSPVVAATTACGGWLVSSGAAAAVVVGSLHRREAELRLLCARLPDTRCYHAAEPCKRLKVPLAPAYCVVIIVELVELHTVG